MDVSGALPIFLFLASQATFPLPRDLAAEPHVEIELVGVVGSHTYKSGERIEKDSALTLLEPIDLNVGVGEPTLSNIVIVQLLAWSDAALFEFSQHNEKVVRVRCHMTVSTMWGYRHASCSPVTMRVGT